MTTVDWALGEATAAGRFGEGDLVAILAHQAQAAPSPVSRASENATLTQGSAGWASAPGG